MNLKNTKSFAFITTPLDAKFSGTIEIISGHHFSRATDNEIKRIKKFLVELLGQKFYGYPYEVDILFEKANGNSKSFKPSRLSKKKWRYYIIKFKGSNEKVINLERAANIAPVEFHSNLLFIGKDAVQYNAIWLFQYFNNLRYTPAEGIQIVNKKDIKEIGNIYNRIISIKQSYPDIERSIEMFYDLNHLSPQTDLIILGLFAVIESIITHQPKLDRGDSLCHQIKTKIPLLLKRLDDKINYNNFFGNFGEGTIWGALYDYRSGIAHGGKINFSRKLKILKDKRNVINFLRIVTKSLLRHALLEPQLYTDLREC